MTSWPRVAPLVFGLLVLSPPAWASSAPGAQDTSALRFRGFRAGATLDELGAVVRAGGGRLRCERARRDRRVSECRATVHDSAIGGAVKVWASTVDSVASVITLAATVDAAALDRWRHELETRYGRVGVRAQGSQWMMQWVRRGRMLRLTWRIERGERTASVSLVDGRVLDAWGAQRYGASP
jgi:hypothetical protein